MKIINLVLTAYLAALVAIISPFLGIIAIVTCYAHPELVLWFAACGAITAYGLRRSFERK